MENTKPIEQKVYYEEPMFKYLVEELGYKGPQNYDYVVFTAGIKEGQKFHSYKELINFARSNSDRITDVGIAFDGEVEAFVGALDETRRGKFYSKYDARANELKSRFVNKTLDAKNDALVEIETHESEYATDKLRTARAGIENFIDKSFGVDNDLEKVQDKTEKETATMSEKNDPAIEEQAFDAMKMEALRNQQKSSYWSKLEALANKHADPVELTRATDVATITNKKQPGTREVVEDNLKPAWFESGNPTQEDIENIAKRISAGVGTEYDLAIYPKFKDQIEGKLQKIKTGNPIPKSVSGASIPTAMGIEVAETQPQIKDPKIFLKEQPQTRKTLITMEMPGGNSLETLTVVELREIETRLKTKIAVLAKAVDEFTEGEWKEQKQEFKTRMQNAVLDFQMIAGELSKRGVAIDEYAVQQSAEEIKKREGAEKLAKLKGEFDELEMEAKKIAGRKRELNGLEMEAKDKEQEYQNSARASNLINEIAEMEQTAEQKIDEGGAGEIAENKEIAEMNDQEIIQSMQILIPESVSISLKPEYLRIILQLKLSKLFEVLPENIFDIEKLLKNKTPEQIAEDLGARKLFEQYKVIPDALSIRKLVYIAKYLRWMSPTEREKREKTVYEFTKGRVQGM